MTTENEGIEARGK